MQTKLKKPCNYTGCPNLTDGTYCDKHRNKAAKEYNAYVRSLDHAKKYGREWKRKLDRYVRHQS